jgi:uncharacterized membrane protein YphA (DoxX/SURF4 family)
MFEVRTPEPIPSRIGVLAVWLPRVAIALVFVSVGLSKFSDPMWVRLFGRIGFGQWFRYFTGVMQIAGGVLVLIPRLALVGIAILACTMAGAIVTWIAFGLVGNAPIPGALLIVLLALGWSEYDRTRD